MTKEKGNPAIKTNMKSKLNDQMYKVKLSQN